MSRNHALMAIRELARSNDFYKKFYDAILVIPESLMEDFWRQVESLEDVVDLVKFIENNR